MNDQDTQMTHKNAELIDADKGIFKVLDTVILQINSPYLMQFIDIEEENARGGTFSFFDKLGEEYVEIASITVADVTADATEPNIENMTRDAVAAFDASYLKACSESLPAQGRKLLKWMGSQLNESEGRKGLVTSYAVDESGEEKQFLAVRISGNSKKLAAIGTFNIARANELAAPIFSILQNMQIISRSGDEPLNVRQMIYRDFGIDIPLESGVGKKYDPFKISAPDQHLQDLYQNQLLNCICLGRGIYWKTHGREIVSDNNGPLLEKVSIETMELTDTQKVTQIESSYFDVTKIDLIREPSRILLMDTPSQALSLPFEIGWLHFRNFHIFQNDPHLGFSATYACPDVEATLYFYDNGLSCVPHNLNDQLVQSEFEKAVAGVIIRHPGTEVLLDAADDRRLMRVYKLDPDGFKVTSVTLTTSNNHFAKIRITWNRDNELDAMAMNFVEIVSNLLRINRH